MPCRNLTGRPTTSAGWRNRNAGAVARTAAVIPRRGRREAAIGTEPSGSSFPLLTAKAGHLNRARRSPIRGSAKSNGRPLFGRPLYPCCSNGGYGYERFRSHPRLAVDHRFRSPVRPPPRFVPVAGDLARPPAVIKLATALLTWG